MEIEKIYNLEDLHSHLRSIISDFETVCRRLDIKYYMAYGTLLGAVRHKNIIPWDDDVDLVMSRSDYDKLVEYYSNGSVDGYDFFCPELDEKCYVLFGKFVRLGDADKDLKQYFTAPDGLSIDVFPLDDALHPGKIRQYLTAYSVRMLSRIIGLKVKMTDENYRKTSGNLLVKKLVLIPFLPFSVASLKKRVVRMCRKYEKYGTDNCAMYCGIYKVGLENFSKSVFSETEILPLGEYEFTAPKEYKVFLEQVYGKDYMQIPPEHARHLHDHLYEEAAAQE